MVDAAWSTIEPILEVWKALPGHFPNYAAGTGGPAAANDLIERDGRRWRPIEDAGSTSQAATHS